jgi:hypothetical protein
MAMVLLTGCGLGGGNDDEGGLPVVGRPVGAMSEERFGHAATLLRDGRVLVTGGWWGDVRKSRASAATTEIYDPATERWSRAASMQLPHAYHTATLLADGRVLVVGGNAVSSVAPSAEVYDPVTDTWRATPDPAHAYHHHSATLLADGRVLVAGGNGPIVNPQFPPTSGGAQDVAEVYDPAGDRWSPAGHLQIARKGHGAARLPDGRVMILGGTEGGGEPGGTGNKTWVTVPLATTELYDPATNRWEPGPPAPAKGGSSVATLADGRLLLSSDKFTALFDPATRAWRDFGAGRGIVLGSALASGLVLVAEPDTPQGGFSTSGKLGLFDAATGEYRLFGRLKQAPRGSYSATLLADGRVLFAGIGDDTSRGAEVVTVPR